MPHATQADLPDTALLARYQASGDYVDCFYADVPGAVNLAQYIWDFYASLVFWPERMVLGLIGKGANGLDIAALADNRTHDFAAWTVEDRTDEQLLMCDFRGSTRSWLAVSNQDDATRLWFGSAVIAHKDAAGDKVIPTAAQALMGFHTAYSRALLSAAANRVIRPDIANAADHT